MRFQGTDTYIATEDLQMAVNAAVTLERPLLIRVSRVRVKQCSPRKWRPPSAGH